MARAKIIIYFRKAAGYVLKFTASCKQKSGGKALAERKAKMEDKKTNYGPKDIAEDLCNLCDEILADTETALAETRPEDFDADEWGKLREAIADVKKSSTSLTRGLTARRPRRRSTTPRRTRTATQPTGTEFETPPPPRRRGAAQRERKTR